MVVLLLFMQRRQVLLRNRATVCTFLEKYSQMTVKMTEARSVVRATAISRRIASPAHASLCSFPMRDECLTRLGGCIITEPGQKPG